MPVKQKMTIEKIVFGGDGLARVEGQVCFVPAVIKGETVFARVRQKKKGFLRAKLIEVVDPSAERVSPPCQYFRTCGGCQYQHMSYAEELRVKESQVREAFERGLRIAPEKILPVRPSPSDYHYRYHVTLHPSQTKSAGPQRLGYVSRDGRTIIPIEECLLADSRLEGVFKSGEKIERGKDRISFWLSEEGNILSDREGAFFKISILNRSLVTHTRAFFQNNLGVTEGIVGQLKKWIHELEPLLFADLYAGMGLFSLLAAAGIKEIVCVEENPYAVQALKQNTAESSGTFFQIFEGKVEKILPDLFISRDFGEGVLFLDPPRTGLDPHLSDFLASVRARALIYLSCDLAILIRDLKNLLRQGKFEIRQVIPFDMFPRTRHIETLVLMAGKTPDG